MNNEILMQVLDEQSKAYELAVMSALTECEKGWRKNSGFPFLHIATYDYYVQKYMEPRLETFIRTYLFNQVLDKLFSHCGFETKPVRIPEGCDFLTNEELEKRLEFELIISKANHTIGLRYTDFEDCYNPGIKSKVDEILILNLQEPFSVEGYDPSSDETDDGTQITWTCLKALFAEYFGVEYYLYTDFLEKEMQKTQEYIGIKSLQKLSPNYMFSFRQRVNSLVRNDIEELVGYQPIEEYNIQRHKDLQEKSRTLILSSGGYDRYKENKLYKLLFGRTDVFKSLVSSEFLREQFPCDECFDFTSVVSGYLKSVEQLMYRIAKLSIDKGFLIKKNNSSDKIDFSLKNENKIDQTMGAIKYFFQDNQDQLLLVNSEEAKTFFWCITLYGNECRNHSFHKNIVDDWNTVEIIRKNTLFMYALLLTSCKLGDTDDINRQIFELVDDRIEQLLLFIKEWDHEIKDLYVQFSGEPEHHISAVPRTGFPQYDDFGYLVNPRICFETDNSNPLLISREHFPDQIWYIDRKNQKRTIPFI